MDQPSANLPGPATPPATARDSGTDFLAFAGFRLEPDGSLFQGETPVHLPPKELAALRLLLEHAGHIVTPLQMRQALWGEIHVSTDSITKCVSSLRSRLQLEDCIQTVYKRGYRFTAQVEAHASPPGGPLVRLAIAPFAISQGVPEYLGAVLAEEIAAGLTRSRHPSLSVLAQDSVSTLAQRGLMAHEIGEKLHADLVLTGSLRALPSHFRMGAEMIRVVDGVQIWAEDLLVDRNRTAGLEMELAARLNFRLHPDLPAEQTTSLPPAAEGLSISAAAAEGRQEENPRRREAYEIFQSASHEWRSLQRHRMQDGLQHLLRAIDLDPAMTAARVDLANLGVAQSLYGYMAPDAAARLVRRAAEPLFDPPGRTPAMLPALGWLSFHFDHDMPAALRAFALSSHLPHDHWTTLARSMFALSRRRFAEAIDMLRAAIEVDPFSPWLHGRLAWALHLAGHAKESLDQADNALQLFPGETSPSFYAALILAFNKQPGRAIPLAQDLLHRMPYFDLASAALAYALARDGRHKEARDLLEQLEWRSRERFVIAGFTAAVYLELAETDTALELLRTSMRDRCPWFFQMLDDPRLKPLHSRPEFQQMRSLLSGMEAAAARAAE